MAWSVNKSGFLGRIAARRKRCSTRRSRRSRIVNAAVFRGRHYADHRGRYRVFNPAVFRLYRSNTGPPLESDTPFETSATLPFQSVATFGNGTWWLSMSRFNGVLDSGFLPLGRGGETFLRLDIVGGAEVSGPPNPPSDFRLIQLAGGVVQVRAFYWQPGGLRAVEWAITLTTDGSTPVEPPAVSPTITKAMPNSGLAVLTYDLPAEADAIVVKVRLQTRRLLPAISYSEDSAVLSETVDRSAASAVLAADYMRGRNLGA